MSELEVDLALTEPQEDFVFSEHQFPAFVGGFGAGKSDALVTRLMMKKLLYPRAEPGHNRVIPARSIRAEHRR